MATETTVISAYNDYCFALKKSTKQEVITDTIKLFPTYTKVPTITPTEAVVVVVATFCGLANWPKGHFALQKFLNQVFPAVAKEIVHFKKCTFMPIALS